MFSPNYPHWVVHGDFVVLVAGESSIPGARCGFGFEKREQGATCNFKLNNGYED